MRFGGVMRKFREIRRSCYTFFVTLCIILAVLSQPVFAEDEFPLDIRTAPSGQSFDGKLVILHSNDVHGKIDGYPKISTLKKLFEEQGAEVMLIDAGDFSQGDPYVNENKGEDAITLMNSTGYSIAVPGNHEFDYGVERLEENLKKAEFTMLCANLEKNGELMFEPRTVFHAKNGADIGFFGLNTPETLIKSNPKRVAGLSVSSGHDMYKCAGEQVDALRKEGAEAVIAITHLGVNEESAMEGNRSLDLFNAVDGIDLVIDGHSHTAMTSGEKKEPVQQTGSRFENVGVIVIDGDAKIEDHYFISPEDLEPDPDVELTVNKIKKNVDDKYSTVIAESEVGLEGYDEKSRSQETCIGDLIADAFLWYADEHKELPDGSDGGVLSMVNGGGIRDSIPSGNVTKKDIYKVLPFGDTMSIESVTGEELLEILEASTFCAPDPVGGYPQTSGIEFSVDTSKEYDAGELYPNSTYHRPASIRRVTIESINGKPFDKKAKYTVCLCDFMASGGDTYYVFGTKKALETGVQLDDILTEYIIKGLEGVIPKEKYGTVRGSQKQISAGEGASASGKYTVVRGDHLSKIAKEKLGDGRRWTEIFDLNRDSLPDPDMIYPGQTLILPAA